MESRVVVIRNIILGNMNISNLDEQFGNEYNEQNDRYKTVLKIFINKIKNEISVGRITPEEIDLYIDKINNKIKDVNSLSNRYILGENLSMEQLETEISRLLGIEAKVVLDDVEDMFDIPSNDTISEIQLESYRRDKENLMRDFEFGIITEEQLKEIEQKLMESDGNEMGKTLTKAKPGFKSQMQKEVTLGFVEPVLLSLIISGIGLLYVAYLYLVV